MLRRFALKPFSSLLLAGIAAAVIVPDVVALQGMAQLLPYAGGLVATALAARRLGNAGVAVIAGVAVYGVLLMLAGYAA